MKDKGAKTPDAVRMRGVYKIIKKGKKIKSAHEERKG